MSTSFIHNKDRLKNKTGFTFLLIFTFAFWILTFNEANAGFIFQRPLYIGLTNGLVGYWNFDPVRSQTPWASADPTRSDRTSNGVDGPDMARNTKTVLAGRSLGVDPTGFAPASPFAKDGILLHELQARIHGVIIKQKKPFIQGLLLFSKRVARISYEHRLINPLY